MLTKLMKYDFKAIFKYWWIMALTSLIMSVSCGFSIAKIIEIENTMYDFDAFIIFFCIIIIIVTFISFVVFGLITYILIYVRYYSNFFTDEGYLTFTLPVKLKQLLDSKLISSFCAIVCTVLTITIDVFIIILIAGHKELLFVNIVDTLFFKLQEASALYGWYLLIYGIEFVLYAVLSTVCSILLTFCCITLASIIVKKSKVFMAIVFYYAATWIYSLIQNIFYLTGSSVISICLETIPAHKNLVLALGGFTALCLIVLVCTLLYLWQYWMLDKKLNLN